MSLPFEIEQRMDEIRSEVASMGAELLDVHFRGGHGRSVIAFTVDKRGGITLDECAAINRRLGEWLDKASGQYDGTGGDMIQGSYFLEVQSPGLDRPIRTEADFNRAAGEKVAITWRDGQGRVETFVGTVREAARGKVAVVREGVEAALELSLEQVIKAKRQIQFKR